MSQPKTPKAPRRPPAKVVLKPLDERRFQENVKRIARIHGACGFHVSFSQGAVTGIHTIGLGDGHYDSNGFPDWVFVTHDGRLLFRELKSSKGQLTFDQKRWHRLLAFAGQDVDVWRPGDEMRVAETFSVNRDTVT